MVPVGSGVPGESVEWEQLAALATDLGGYGEREGGSRGGGLQWSSI